MRYEKPTYKIEFADSKDIIASSLIRSEVNVTEVYEDQAKVSVSANDILGRLINKIFAD